MNELQEEVSVKVPDFEPGWIQAIGGEFSKSYMYEVKRFLHEEVKGHTVYPPSSLIFNAFHQTPFEKIKVVILGQDPYHGPGQAHGLCFSVPEGVAPPPSLINIFKEIENDLGVQPPNHGCLESWAGQGVFLLNTSLTVRAHEAGSHAGKGWETFTDHVIETISTRLSSVVFLLWGRPARAKAKLIDTRKHFILEAAHPSPLSAHRGFFGCQHFSKTNEILDRHWREPIDWSL